MRLRQEANRPAVVGFNKPDHLLLSKMRNCLAYVENISYLRVNKTIGHDTYNTA